MIRILFSILFTIFTLFVFAQAKTDAGYLYRGIVINGDTMPHINIRPVVVLPPIKFKNKNQYLKFTRLIANVKKVYPYSQLAKQTFYEISIVIDTIPNERERKQYIKQREQELLSTYSNELKKLSITQGHILIKLIDRELGRTSYDILKELRGSFSAFMWQSIARLFGENLKDKFDAEGDDELIDRIIIMIENGEI